MSVKAERSCNGMYEDLYDKAKKLITRDASMKFYDALKPLYLKMGASTIGLGTSLL